MGTRALSQVQSSRGMALANHSHLVQTLKRRVQLSLYTQESKGTVQQKDRTVCNGRPRNINHQYTEYYEVVTINVVKPRVKVR
jgi:hypothetical protein